VGVLAQAGGAQAAGCDRIAAPGGSDDAAGTEAAPYRTLQRLTSSLDAGQTGCLRAGSYGGDETSLEKPGTGLTSYPGERATITAFLEVEPGARGAHVNHLNFDTATSGNEVGVKLQADNTVFSDNQVTKGGRGICLSAASSGPATGIIIEHNHIYDCGPSKSKWDHQIYLVHSRGAIVRWNILSGNAGGWGVHLFTDADGSVIEHNVIDGNRGGVIFAGDDGDTSDRNIVRNNAITYSGPRWNIESSWSGGPSGSGNVASNNCLYSPDGDGGVATEDGFSARQNSVLGGSPYVNRAAGDYRFRPGSKCAALVGDVAGTVTEAPVHTAPTAPVRLSLRPAKVRNGAKMAKVLLVGRIVSRSSRGRSATQHVSTARVRLQFRTGGGWRTIARRKMRRGRFSIWVGVQQAHAGVASLRAVVPGLARSQTVHLRVKR
jgi:hypothetical protein